VRVCAAEFKPSVGAHVREYSFLSNPRVPAAFAAARNVTALDVRGGAAELRRLRAMAAARVLHLTNVPLIADELWVQQPRTARDGGRRRPLRRWRREATSAGDGLLTDGQWAAFRQAFASVQGGWCCAPRGLKPHASGFHLLRAPSGQAVERRLR
jgi:hypothetical protein